MEGGFKWGRWYSYVLSEFSIIDVQERVKISKNISECGYMMTLKVRGQRLCIGCVYEKLCLVRYSFNGFVYYNYCMVYLTLYMRNPHPSNPVISKGE